MASLHERWMESFWSVKSWQVVCPPVGRRSFNELVVRLVVVNIIVICSYGHLLWMRNQRDVLRLALFVLCPLTALWTLLGPFVGLLIYAIVHPMDTAAIKNAYSILFGKMPKDLECVKVDIYIERQPRNTRLLCARLVAQALLIAQCSLSLWLVTRRFHIDGLMMLDFKVFQLAVAGLCVACLTICESIFEPTYPVHVRPGWLYYLRPVQVEEVTTNASAFFWEFLPPLAAESVFLVLRSMLLKDAPLSQQRLSVAESLADLHSQFGLWTYSCISCVAIFFATLGLLRLLYPGEPLWAGPRMTSKTVRTVCCAVVLVLMLKPLQYAIQDYAVILLRYHNFRGMGTLPTETACPQAWRDPFTSWIWSFT